MRPESSGERPARETRVPAQGDLPAYILRVSLRAKHVRLTVTPHEGLVVVVPQSVRGFDPSRLLRSKRAWIDASLERFAHAGQAYSADHATLLPDDVVFPATGEAWSVEYRPTSSARVSARDAHGTLTVAGATADADACLAALNRWLQVRAKERLLPMLQLEAESAGLDYSRVGVRGQKSRWGSCSAKGSITLNRCLLFLPRELVDAVILHELAHLRHHDHSPAFWRELERLDPDARGHREAIRRAWSAVPAWAEPWTRGRA